MDTDTDIAPTERGDRYGHGQDMDHKHRRGHRRGHRHVHIPGTLIFSLPTFGPSDNRTRMFHPTMTEPHNRLVHVTFWTL